MRFGVVCEGSHDFIVLQKFLASALNIAETNVQSIQPQLDATLAQMGGGGYGRVKVWCVQNSGRAFYQNIGVGLFSRSETFDHILVHLDGDVIEKTGWFAPAEVASANASAASRCAIVRNWIETTLAYSGGDELCTAIPVRSTDAWVLATIRPDRCLEHHDVKNRLTRYLGKFFGPSRNQALQIILPYCSSQIQKASQTNASLRDFLDGLP